MTDYTFTLINAFLWNIHAHSHVGIFAFCDIFYVIDVDSF